MYLDFEKEEKGYKRFYLTRENIISNIGKKICYVDKRTVCKYRGYYTVQIGIIHSVRYSRLLLNDGDNEVDIRDILECGIKTEV